MILCACSPYFKNLLEQNPAKHPIIILKDVPFQHLTAILEFMYAGEVNVAQVDLIFLIKCGFFSILILGPIASFFEDCREAEDQRIG